MTINYEGSPFAMMIELNPHNHLISAPVTCNKYKGPVRD